MPNVLAGKDTLLKMMQNRAEVNKGWGYTISTCMTRSSVQTLWSYFEVDIEIYLAKIGIGSKFWVMEKGVQALACVKVEGAGEYLGPNENIRSL